MAKILIPKQVGVLRELLIPPKTGIYDSDLEVTRYVRISVTKEEDLIAEVISPKIYVKMTIAKKVLNSANNYNIENITDWDEVFITEKVMKQLWQIKYKKNASNLVKETLAQVVKVQNWIHKKIYEFWQVDESLQKGITYTTQINETIRERFNKMSKEFNYKMQYIEPKTREIKIQYPEMIKILKVIKEIAKFHKLNTEEINMSFSFTFSSNIYWFIHLFPYEGGIKIEGLLP